MAKIGRNDPCPCGSAKKYKKCCLQKEQQKERETRTQQATERYEKDRRRLLDQLHPYEALVEYRVMTKGEAPSAGGGSCGALWTPQAVMALGVPEILRRLSELGIEVTEEGFRDLASTHRSAWDLAGPWCETQGVLPFSHEADFLGLAAHALWCEWCADTPSFEMVSDLVDHGFERQREGDSRAAVDSWLQAWEKLRPRLEPGLRSPEVAAKKRISPSSLSEMAFELAISVSSVACPIHPPSCRSGDGSPDVVQCSLQPHDVDAKLAHRGLEFIRQYLRQFPEEDRNEQRTLRSALAELLCGLGEWEDGNRTFEDLIADDPADAMPYASYSECHQFFRPHPEIDDGLRKAEAILVRALSHPVHNAADWDIEDRLKGIRAALKQRTGSTANDMAS